MILTADQLRGFWPWLTPFQKDFTDATYWTPDKQFLREVADICWNMLTKYDLGDWREYWDCDDFALFYHAVSRAHFARGGYAKKHNAQAPAIGQCSYIVWRSDMERAGAGHRIDWYIGDDVKVHYIEPQATARRGLDDEFVVLVEREIKSIWKVYA